MPGGLVRAAPAAEVRERIHAILARPEFGGGDSALSRAIRRFVERVMKALSEIFGFSLDGSRDLLAVVVYALLISAVVIVAWLVIRSRLRARGRTRAGTPAEAQADSAARRRERVSDLRARADLARAAGERLLALRLYFTALVVGLGETGDLEYREAWTNRELFERGRPKAAVHAALAPIAADLDRKSFGGVPATEEDVASMSRLVEQMLPPDRPVRSGAREPRSAGEAGRRG